MPFLGHMTAVYWMVLQDIGQYCALNALDVEEVVNKRKCSFFLQEHLGTVLKAQKCA